MDGNDVRHAKQLIGEIWTTDEPYRNLEECCDVIGSRWTGTMFMPGGRDGPRPPGDHGKDPVP